MSPLLDALLTWSRLHRDYQAARDRSPPESRMILATVARMTRPGLVAWQQRPGVIGEAARQELAWRAARDAFRTVLDRVALSDRPPAPSVLTDLDAAMDRYRELTEALSAAVGRGRARQLRVARADEVPRRLSRGEAQRREARRALFREGDRCLASVDQLAPALSSWATR